MSTQFEKSFIPIDIPFSAIEPIWSKHLWPVRTSKIEPVSAINKEGGIDMAIFEIAKPVFLKIVNEGKIVGVTSFFETDQNQWRLRGTWVHENFRGIYLGSLLLNYSMKRISGLDPKADVWTMARKKSENFYLKNEFKPLKIVGQYEYGPHIIMSKPLQTNL